MFLTVVFAVNGSVVIIGWAFVGGVVVSLGLGVLVFAGSKETLNFGMNYNYPIFSGTYLKKKLKYFKMNDAWQSHEYFYHFKLVFPVRSNILDKLKSYTS